MAGVTAVAWVQSRAWDLLHATDAEKPQTKKPNKQKENFETL